uniref:Uncharacterized protein n=1 Tax=Anguilla anguilla TaxID=7936 RepID=A0A0E9QLY6_ANGAN
MTAAQGSCVLVQHSIMTITSAEYVIAQCSVKHILALHKQNLKHCTKQSYSIHAT